MIQRARMGMGRGADGMDGMGRGPGEGSGRAIGCIGLGGKSGLGGGATITSGG
jgi:hypothetical protein